MSLAAMLADREKVVTTAALVLAAVLAWTYTLLTAVYADPAMDMPMAWSAADSLVVFVMWWLMMVAMMLPSATPAILLFAALRKSSLAGLSGRGSTLAFGAGYLAIWGMFSLGATALQWLLQSSNMLSGTLGLTQWTWGAALLVGVGLYQISPLKAACLSSCRAPAQMLARYWRPGMAGALVMGMQHGIFCLGCCAFIMLLLFFGGIMSLYWVAGLALYVAVEKLAPFGGRFSKLAGYGLIAVGLTIAAGYGTGHLS